MRSSEGKGTALRFGDFVFSNYIRRFEKRIYIPLPGPEARKRMFELNVGSTPCELKNQDYRALADKTPG
jgi:SpoVK/Ycf46/Vps4 family AAA+-type ATPase